VTTSNKAVLAWAIEYTGSPFDFSRRYLRGVADHPCHTLLFETRNEAREWLRNEKTIRGWAFQGRWASDGGSRVYTNARVVPVRIVIAVDL